MKLTIEKYECENCGKNKKLNIRTGQCTKCEKTKVDDLNKGTKYSKHFTPADEGRMRALKDRKLIDY